MANRLNAIVFPISSGLKSQYNSDENAGLFEESWLGLNGNYLVLPATDYRRDNLKDDVLIGYAGGQLLKSSEKVEIEVTIEEGREAAYKILETLISDAESGNTFTPITCLDFFCSDGVNDYTVRSVAVRIDSRPVSFYSAKYGLLFASTYKLILTEIG